MAAVIDRDLVASLLSTRFGRPVQVASCERIAPWSIARCTLARPGTGLPRSVVVKWLRDDANGSRVDPQQLLTERAALEFLGDLGLEIAPSLIASDRATTLLVLEDLRPRVPLYELLDGAETAAGSVGLAAFARALGTMAAGTVGRSRGYYARCRALGPVDPWSDRVGPFAKRWATTCAASAAVGVAVPASVEAEMGDVLEALAEPRAFLALSNGDAGDNNFLIADHDPGRIIDFEFAGYRHALLDAACLHVPGPRWITMPDPVRTGLEDVHRAALVAGIPEASDDRAFGRAMAAAAIATAIERAAGRIARVDARPAGDGSRAQMIATLESAARAATHHRSLPHLAGWCRELAGALRARWPDAGANLTRLSKDPAVWVRR